jgi:hypothetical protein
VIIDTRELLTTAGKGKVLNGRKILTWNLENAIALLGPYVSLKNQPQQDDIR